MGNSFVPFHVSIVISHGQFHCGNRGHTQNADFPWVKSHFPVGKRSSGTAAIDQLGLGFFRVRVSRRGSICYKNAHWLGSQWSFGVPSTSVPHLWFLC